MGGGWEGVGGEEVLDECAGASRGLLWQGERFRGRSDGGVGVVGEVEGDVLGAGAGGSGDGCGVVGGGEPFVSLLTAVEEEGCHQEDACNKTPEEDALVTGDHFAAPTGIWRLRQDVRAAAMALAMFC